MRCATIPRAVHRAPAPHRCLPPALSSPAFWSPRALPRFPTPTNPRLGWGFLLVGWGRAHSRIANLEGGLRPRPARETRMKPRRRVLGNTGAWLMVAWLQAGFSHQLLQHQAMPAVVARIRRSLIMLRVRVLASDAWALRFFRRAIIRAPPPPCA